MTPYLNLSLNLSVTHTHIYINSSYLNPHPDFGTHQSRKANLAEKGENFILACYSHPIRLSIIHPLRGNEYARAWSDSSLSPVARLRSESMHTWPALGRSFTWDLQRLLFIDTLIGGTKYNPRSKSFCPQAFASENIYVKKKGGHDSRPDPFPRGGGVKSLRPNLQQPLTSQTAGFI